MQGWTGVLILALTAVACTGGKLKPQARRVASSFIGFVTTQTNNSTAPPCGGLCVSPTDKVDPNGIVSGIFSSGNVSCGVLQESVKSLNDGEDCRLLKAAAWGSGNCGCEVAPSFECPFCQQDGLELDPQTPAGLSGGTVISCGVLQVRAEFNSNQDDAQCRAFQTLATQDRCCAPAPQPSPSPTTFPNIEPKQNCTDDPLPLEFIAKERGRQTCDEFKVQTESRAIPTLCESFRRIRRRCRQTCESCRPRQDCVDNANSTFPKYVQFVNTCQWLSRRKPKRRRSICNYSPNAREKCANTCATC